MVILASNDHWLSCVYYNEAGATLRLPCLASQPRNSTTSSYQSPCLGLCLCLHCQRVSVMQTLVNTTTLVQLSSSNREAGSSVLTTENGCHKVLAVLHNMLNSPWGWLVSDLLYNVCGCVCCMHILFCTMMQICICITHSFLWIKTQPYTYTLHIPFCIIMHIVYA